MPEKLKTIAIPENLHSELKEEAFKKKVDIGKYITKILENRPKEEIKNV